jgi:hypothetical protein
VQRWRGLQAGTQDGNFSSLDPDSTYAQDSNRLVFRELHTNSILTQFKNALGTYGGTRIVAIEDGKLIFVF